jgi:uncharacterized protein YggE
MTNTDRQTLLSVRGEAEHTVAADQASIHCSARTIQESKRAAIATVSETVTAVAGALAALGGEVLTVSTARASLTWSTHSIQTNPEYEKANGTHGPTGRHEATASFRMAVRDFALLSQVEAVLADQEGLDVHSVSWSVDDDNAGWALVRADAIRAALLKGHDYAAALGGSVTSVEHVADAGLLGESSSPRTFQAHATSLAGGGDSASLDPVPQVLRAVIEARLTAAIGPLASS